MPQIKKISTDYFFHADSANYRRFKKICVNQLKSN